MAKPNAKTYWMIGALAVAMLIYLLLPVIKSALKKPGPDQPDSLTTKPAVNVPDFSADSAYAFVKKQVDFGPRVPNSAPHAACADWLFSELKKYCDTVYRQKASATTYDRTQIAMQNLIGVINPEAETRIMLCSHWDSRPVADEDSKDQDKPILGANDGASGVGVLLELARNMSKNRPGVGIDIIFFDGEDWGNPGGPSESYCLGSQHWAKNPHIKGYKARYGILLDMVGGVNAKFAMEGYSLSFAPDIVSQVWSTASELGYGNYFVQNQRGSITDDHYFVNRYTGMPIIDIIQWDPNTGGFADHWHTHRDDMTAIDRATLKAVGQTLAAMVYHEK